jgi:ribonuclease-3
MKNRRQATFDALESSLDYHFSDRTLLLEALTHRSYVNESRERGLKDNQRLEFFGDSVLGLLVSRRLLELLPGSGEGNLSRIRASMVDEDTLAGLAEGIRLGEFLLLGRGEDKTGGRGKKSILADAFEALVAAVYLDGGFDAAAGFVDRFFNPLLGRSVDDAVGRDYKTRLQELCQPLFGVTPVYVHEEAAGPDHARVFTATVRVGEDSFGTGSGKSKKEAEQAAAREGILCLEQRKAELGT